MQVPHSRGSIKGSGYFPGNSGRLLALNLGISLSITKYLNDALSRPSYGSSLRTTVKPQYSLVESSSDSKRILGSLLEIIN